jgi:hypothetical protein
VNPDDFYTPLVERREKRNPVRRYLCYVGRATEAQEKAAKITGRKGQKIQGLQILIVAFTVL